MADLVQKKGHSIESIGASAGPVNRTPRDPGAPLEMPSGNRSLSNILDKSKKPYRMAFLNPFMSLIIIKICII
jgi:hypothetical protein